MHGESTDALGWVNATYPETLLYQLVETHDPAFVDELAWHGKALLDNVRRDFQSFL